MSYFSDLESSSVFRRPRSPPPLVPINSSEIGRESVIRLRSANKNTRFRPYTRVQRWETEITVFNMKQRWQDTGNIINKLKSHQIGKTPEQIAQELQNHRLHLENLNRRKADKVFETWRSNNGRRKSNICGQLCAKWSRLSTNNNQWWTVAAPSFNAKWSCYNSQS